MYLCMFQPCWATITLDPTSGIAETEWQCFLWTPKLLPLKADIWSLENNPFLSLLLMFWEIMSTCQSSPCPTISWSAKIRLSHATLPVLSLSSAMNCWHQCYCLCQHSWCVLTYFLLYVKPLKFLLSNIEFL